MSVTFHHTDVTFLLILFNSNVTRSKILLSVSIFKHVMSTTNFVTVLIGHFDVQTQTSSRPPHYYLGQYVRCGPGSVFGIALGQYVRCGPGSVFGIATGYGLDGPGSRWGGEIFRTCPDRPSDPPSLLYNGYRVFPGRK